MTQPQAASLVNVKAGDMILGLSEDGLPKLLYVYRSYPDRVLTRLVTSQTKYSFGRNGHSLQTWDGKSCWIVPTDPLTTAERAVALGIDEKMRSARTVADIRLSDTEAQLLARVARRAKAYAPLHGKRSSRPG